jgi:hypothetical protein
MEKNLATPVYIEKASEHLPQKSGPQPYASSTFKKSKLIKGKGDKIKPKISLNL